MAFGIYMNKAAERNFKAAEYLYEKTALHCIAGYLYGIAAECAIKHIMHQGGLTAQFPKGKDPANPMYAHFPDLKRLLGSYIRGRRAQVLRPVLENHFMNEWDITMRYTATRSISKKKVERWREQAKSIIGSMRQL